MNILTKGQKELGMITIISILMVVLYSVSERASANVETMKPEVAVEIPASGTDSPYAGISEEMTGVLERATLSDNNVETVEAAAPVVEEVMAPVYPIVNRESFAATKYVSASSLNIRKEPNENSEVAKIVPLGTPLNIVEQVHIQLNESDTAEWVMIEGGGYVNAKFLQETSPVEFIGDYLITYYCPCAKCCRIANRPTASEVMPEQGVTIAADPSIPFGTKLMIEGRIYTVQDRGGKIKGNHIDVFLNSHQEALLKGQHLSKVYLVY